MKTEFIKEVLSLQNNILKNLKSIFTKNIVSLNIETFKEHNWGKTPRECQEINLNITLYPRCDLLTPKTEIEIRKDYKIKTDRLSIDLYLNYILKHNHNFKEFDKANKILKKMIKDLAMNFKGKISLD